MTELKQFATSRQAEYLEAVEQAGSYQAAAKQLGINPETIKRALRQIKSIAAQAGYSPEHGLIEPYPDGFKMGKATIQRGPRGNIERTWERMCEDAKRVAQAQREAYEALAEDLPKLKPVKAPDLVQEELCNVYTLTDSHVGMLAWRKEGGEDWDLKIAETVLTSAFQQMVNSSPNAGTAVIAQLGDWLHYDSALAAETPMHGHSLDADGRMPKMVRVAVRILRRVIDFALLKHNKVVVLLAEGNHDISSSVWLRVMFSALYENEPRVQVIDSELPYYVYQHGKTMLAWHHGHLSKNDQLPLLFASQFPVMWGNTTKRYVHTGHRHHKEIKEHSGMTVHQHSTLAARDAYAARGGWMSEREAMAVTYHKEFGQVGTITVTPEMLAA